jgi:hypothetical protein
MTVRGVSDADDAYHCRAKSASKTPPTTALLLLRNLVKTAPSRYFDGFYLGHG